MLIVLDTNEDAGITPTFLFVTTSRAAVATSIMHLLIWVIQCFTWFNNQSITPIKTLEYHHFPPPCYLSSASRPYPIPYRSHISRFLPRHLLLRSSLPLPLTLDPTLIPTISPVFLPLYFALFPPFWLPPCRYITTPCSLAVPRSLTDTWSLVTPLCVFPPCLSYLNIHPTTTPLYLATDKSLIVTFYPDNNCLLYIYPFICFHPSVCTFYASSLMFICHCIYLSLLLFWHSLIDCCTDRYLFCLSQVWTFSLVFYYLMYLCDLFQTDPFVAYWQNENFKTHIYRGGAHLILI